MDGLLDSRKSRSSEAMASDAIEELRAMEWRDLAPSKK
jgi:hypothetical protein